MEHPPRVDLGRTRAGRLPVEQNADGTPLPAVQDEHAELDRVRETARDVFGWEELRPGQAEAISAVMNGRDALVVMPTGAGKSATYQLPALHLDGPTLVVSPLLALQRDQVEALDRRGEGAEAVRVSSDVGARERREAFEAVREGDAEFLFMSPEQLANPDVVEQVRAAAPSLIAVDEAHVVSAWGHDFRPDYLGLGDVIDALGHPPVIALTATAAPPVRDDIVERLHLRDPFVLVTGFERPNIGLEVVRVRTAEEKRDQVVLRAASEQKPAIVYVATRRSAEEIGSALAELGMSAAAYHAGMRKAERERVQTEFMDGGLDVIVATSAFGMGIDKPDVRTVIHEAVPDSLDSYYQEIGRAGRDGEPSIAVLYYRPEDLGLRRFFVSGALKQEDLVAVARLQAEGLDREAIAERTGLGPRKLVRLLNALEEAGGDDPREQAEQAVEAEEARRRMDRSRIEMLRGYAETDGCRRQFVLGYFGEDLPEPCGNCDTCRAGTAQEAADEVPEDAPFALQSAVVHDTFGEGIVMRYEEDRVVVLFEQEGYKVLALDAVTSNGLLEAVTGEG
nr:ATP-dependent DNA helicase RecQ [Motilibacter aurantiacus]